LAILVWARTLLRMKTKRILIDAREFVGARLTGIGRVLEGLVGALAETDVAQEILLATSDAHSLPLRLKNRSNMKSIELPSPFLKSEKALSNLTRNEIDLFISPYPKLPLFGCRARAAHIIHDILDLTHPAYKKRLKVHFDTWRLKKALRRADLTWYDSLWSQKETREFAGSVGKRPRVRYPGIDDAFSPEKSVDDAAALKKYSLEPGYVIVIGNGLPHKNLGVLLEGAEQISRKIVFVGVRHKNQQYWKSRYPNESATWITHVEEGDLPSLLRAAFCLAQPSTAEGYGYPPLEAVACGVPPVVSDIAVLLETTGSIAIYADPHDPTSWMEALSALEKDELYRAQVEKGLKWVEPLKGAKGWHGHISDIEALLKERS
jgi:glycosyltransferase involved in cell wall biosynthesis